MATMDPVEHFEQDDEDDKRREPRVPAPAQVRLKDSPPPKPPALRAVSETKPETLEDLYAIYPLIGSGGFFLRVARDAPKMFRGHLVHGWITDIHDQIQLQEFHERFGGGTYTIAVVGPVEKDGQSMARQIVTLEMKLQGDPVLTQEDSPMMSMNRSAPPEKVQLEQLRQDERERERTRIAIERASTAPEHVVRAIATQAAQTVEQAKEAADRTVEILKNQVHSLSKTISDREIDLKSMRDEVLRVRTEMQEAVRRAEHDLERRLRETHEGAMRAMTDGHAKEVTALRDAATKEIAQLREQVNKDAREAEARHQNTMNEASRRYVEDMARRDSEASKDRDRIKETADARLVDLRGSLEREITSIRADREREIASLRAQYDSSEKFTKETASIRMSTFSDELTRLRAENERLTTEVFKLQKASVKDPIAFIRETREIAKDVLGMVSAEDAAAARAEQVEEDGTVDWKKEGARALFQFVQKLPDTVKGAVEQVSVIRAQNQQNLAAAQQISQQQAGPGRQLGQGRRRMAPPASLWSGPGSPPPHVGPVHGAEIPFVQPYAPIHRPAVEAPMPQQSQQEQRPTTIMPPGVAQQAQMQQQQAQMQQQQAQMQQQQAQMQQQAPAQDVVTKSGLEVFIGELDAAIGGGVVTAEMFAQGFVSSIGQARAAQLLTEIPVEVFLSKLDESGEGGYITTMKGNEYARLLWREVAKLV